jgi:hypothetical protein
MSDLGTYIRGYYDQAYYPGMGTPVPPAPDPTIGALVPATASVAGGALDVQVNGTEFVAGSKVEVDGAEITTTFVSATELTANYTPAGAARTVQFTVRNPSGKESNDSPFVITLTSAEIGALSIDDVKAFIVRNPDLLAEVYALEQAGKNRTTLVAWLKALLDEDPPGASLTADAPSTDEAPES